MSDYRRSCLGEGGSECFDFKKECCLVNKCSLRSLDRLLPGLCQRDANSERSYPTMTHAPSSKPAHRQHFQGKKAHRKRSTQMEIVRCMAMAR